MSEDDIILLRFNVAEKDIERLEELARKYPLSRGRTLIARTALRIGIDAIEKKPELLFTRNARGKGRRTK